MVLDEARTSHVMSILLSKDISVGICAMIIQGRGPYSSVSIANLKGIWIGIFPRLVAFIL